ncbi:MAG: class I SAM-dependent methyltransferase [Candidatus Shapirobacteria bacterium]|jgi:SAM-dependent methyltransferase
MLQSKPWNWNVADSEYWQTAASEVYPLVSRWKKLNLTRLLDLGCGVGRHALLFASNGFKVSATDLSAEGIEKLNQHAQSNNLQIDTQVADMIALPYANNSFDCLIAYHAIYHQDDQGIKKVISEINRVLTPGGEAFITFNSQSNSAFSDPNNTHLSPNTIIKNSGHESGIPHFYATKGGIEQLLTGFNIVEFSHKEEYYQDDPNYVAAHYFVLVKKI